MKSEDEMIALLDTQARRDWFVWTLLNLLDAWSDKEYIENYELTYNGVCKLIFAPLELKRRAAMITMKHFPLGSLVEDSENCD